MHLPALIEDFGILLIAAAVVSLLFKFLKQPVVLGYLVAGFLVSPHFNFFPTVHEVSSISIWAEIGVIFILFSLGLDFSFRKLKVIGKTAGVTATIEIMLLLAVGYLTGRTLGWKRMDSVFLGGMICVSSTTIIIKTIEELGWKTKSYVSQVFGVLVIEDLIAVLLLVLLSSIALTQTVSGSELAFASLKLVFFIIIWFLLGLYLLPMFLQKVRAYLNDETEVIVALGLCLLMVIVATQAGFSSALGAFVMGSLLAETSRGKAIEQLIQPIKTLFSAIFLVSVGMMIDPAVILKYWAEILLISGVVIAGKFMGVTLGSIVSGKNYTQALQSGLTMTQIGEFSFIIATLGVTLKVTSSFLYPIAVSVSVITSFVTPYLMKNMDTLISLIDQRLPVGFKNVLSNYEQLLNTKSEEKIHTILWKEYGMKILLNAIMVVGVSLLFSRIGFPFFIRRFSDFALALPFAPEGLFFVVTLLFAMPFLWAVFVGQRNVTQNDDEEICEKLQKIQLGVVLVRLIVGLLLVGFIVKQYTSVWALTGMVVFVVSGITVLLMLNFFRPIYLGIEKKFLFNLNQNHQERKPEKIKPILAPWNASLVEIIVSPNSQVIGLPLQDSKLKEKFGVTVAMIERGGQRILSPKRNDVLYPYDHVYLIGTEEQILNAKAALEISYSADVAPLPETFGMTSVLVHEDDFFAYKPIRECGLREKIDGMIVGIEREGERILNPHSSLEIKPHDTLWVVGQLELIQKLRI